MIREGVLKKKPEVWDIVPNCRTPPLPYLGHGFFFNIKHLKHHEMHLTYRFHVSGQYKHPKGKSRKFLKNMLRLVGTWS